MKTLEQKIEEVAELIQKREELRAVLANVEDRLGEIFASNVPAHKKQEKPKKPTLDGVVERRTITCSNCGKKGHFKKTCPNRQVAPPVPEVKARALSSEEYSALKEGISTTPGFSSMAYASKTKLSLREINKAIVSKDYQAYIDDTE